jgi:hypothetical protein
MTGSGTLLTFPLLRPPPHTRGRKEVGGSNPSAEFILSSAEGLRTGSAQRLNGLNVLNLHDGGVVAFAVRISYGKIAATTSSRLRCTCASSVMPQVTAT